MTLIENLDCGTPADTHLPLDVQAQLSVENQSGKGGARLQPASEQKTGLPDLVLNWSQSGAACDLAQDVSTKKDASKPSNNKDQTKPSGNSDQATAPTTAPSDLPNSVSSGDCSYCGATPESNAEAQRQKETQEFSKKNGVVVVNHNGRYEYHMRAGGKDKVLFTTDASEAGLKEADKRLKALVHQKEAELTRKYHVTFSAEGEGATDNGRTIPCREPNLKEVTAVEAALEKNAAGDGSPQGSMGVCFKFLKEPEGPGYLATYHPLGAGGHAAIYVAPDWDSNNMPATQKDVASPDDFSMESTLSHELRHNGQAHQRRDYTPAVPAPHLPPELATEKTGPRTFNGYADFMSPALEKMYERMGWHGVRHGAGYDWYLQGKDGYCYKHEGDLIGGTWVRYDKNQHPVDENGHACSPEKAAHRSGQQMRDLSKVRPSSDYFPVPCEENAEASRQFRGDEASRALLYKKSAELYEITKEMDQAEINQTYPAGADGQPIMIRNPQGRLVPNTPENQAKVSQFEAGLMPNGF